MNRFAAFVFVFTLAQAAPAQDTIERAYFKDARAKNAAIAAARYAEEGYYYTRFSTHVYTVDSSRVFADTALFFIQRALMLADTALDHTPYAKHPATEYLQDGKRKTFTADSVVREYYPMSEIRSHRYFGSRASLHLSNAVMDFFNASLLLGGDSNEPTDANPYKVLPFSDEIVRLEADESSFQHAENLYQAEISKFESMYAKLETELAGNPSPGKKQQLETWMDDVGRQLEQATGDLRDVTHRIGQIRQLLDSKYREDVADVEPPEHTGHFETDGPEGTIEMDPPNLDGLAYKIQLGYYPADVNIEYFHGLFPISGETVRQDLARIYAGLFFTYSEASEGMKYIRANAIPNAFVVAFLNGGKIGLSRAVEIEKGRGLK